MALSLRSWVLGGLGLAASIWILDGITDWLGEWVPAIVLGSGAAWAYLSFAKPQRQLVYRRPVTVERVKTALVEAEAVVNQLAAEVKELAIEGSAQQVSEFRTQLHEILAELKREDIRLVAMGGKRVGKTTLTQLLQTQWATDISHKIHLQDSPELFAAAEAGLSMEAEAWQLAKAGDLVLFVTEGDLTESQIQAIKKLTEAHRRTVVVFNKQDQYLPKEQAEILSKIRDRLRGMVAPEDVVSVAGQPRPMKVRQHQADGSIQEWLEEPEPQITDLTTRLETILATEGQKLILASSLGNVEALKVDAKIKLNQVRRDRAMPIIERAQWVIAGTAFANPFPALDLLATAAISGQMVVELSHLYQKKFSLEQGKTIAKTLAELMVKLGIVEVSTQAIGVVLKTNAITYVAGGALQGVSAAYLTRIAGLALVNYFEGEGETTTIRKDRLQDILKQVFQQNQRSAFIQGFVKQAIDKLMADPQSAKQLAQPLQPLATAAAEVNPVARIIERASDGTVDSAVGSAVDSAAAPEGTEGTIALPSAELQRAELQPLQVRHRLNLPNQSPTLSLDRADGLPESELREAEQLAIEEESLEMIPR
ncbi:DUF697 domain-containing protein [Alkalinema sp. FACHB-956]|uniref:slr1306 family protein n=1 Tax=Alkalinema sp. FACHB-956 TaxID=2692768 RepID=UPI001687BE02|nr:DUF697 domain-containing protein [Alkalinema sp. FACHB-956]MBD2327557.1 DUF697 domain-containing protein [Alkalinema sp. FACHB-956]